MAEYYLAVQVGLSAFFLGRHGYSQISYSEAFSVLKEAGCSDEALCYEMYVLMIYHVWISVLSRSVGGCPRSLQRSSNERQRKGLLIRSVASGQGHSIVEVTNTSSS